MKKIFCVLATVCALLLSASCQKETEAGGVKAETACGQWYVVLEGADAEGNITFADDDLFGIGRFILLTYNTADDNTTDIYVDDLCNGWGMKAVATVDLETLTFSCEDSDNEYFDNNYYTCQKVAIKSGKIVKDGAETPSGQKADYIEFTVVYDDDPYAGVYYDHLVISGWRYTGFSNDD